MNKSSDDQKSYRQHARVKQQCRILLLLDAAERVGIVPLASERLHAFTYLADVLSPVWGLAPFDGKIYKSEGGPHFPDIQEELDHLVVLGLVEVSNLRYEPRAHEGARIAGRVCTELRISSVGFDHVWSRC